MTNAGLEGVIAAETRISGVDGEAGRLIIAGQDVEALAGTTAFEDAATRVLAAGGLAIADLAGKLAVARAAAWVQVPSLHGALSARDGMTALRAAVAQLAATGDDADDAVAAIAAVAVFAAASARLRIGAPPIAPTRAGHAADYLAMTGAAPTSAASARALETYLVTVVDHGMNASTFAARVVASTGSDLISAVVAAIGALKGPLHGGAPGPVLDMLDAVGTAEHADGWLRAELAAGRRIMGMGHRVYRVRDPRAAVLERAVTELGSPRLALARAVEVAAAAVLHERKPDRPLPANVELATAVLLDAVGLTREQFTPTFAVGRVVGWCAHVREQRKGRLIRPASRYVGETAA
jgi:citrate synthase